MATKPRSQRLCSTLRKAKAAGYCSYIGLLGHELHHSGIAQGNAPRRARPDQAGSVELSKTFATPPLWLDPR